MTDNVFSAASTDTSAAPPSSIQTILQCLELPPPPNPTEELALLRANLLALSDVEATTTQHAQAVDGLYRRGIAVVEALLPALAADLMLPIPRKTRRIVRGILDLLQALADEARSILRPPDRHERPDPNQAPELALWRSVYALAQQLMIGHLIAAPARAGAWEQMHRIYATARQLGLTTHVPMGASRSIEDVYHGAVLLGCAQPASLTPREVLFLAAYFERFANMLETLPGVVAAAPGTFWIDPERDTPALSCSRKIPPPTAPLDCFSCVGICVLLKTQIAELDTGMPPDKLNLPEFACTPAGRGVLSRLLGRWSDSGKRRFHRRRQNCRTLLSAGIDGLWQLSQKGDAVNVYLSTWMITNESPEGYAVMHVSGKVGTLSVGDVAAVRTGSDQNWQICMVRWAVSENPEHLELGLQILAPRAVPAVVAQASDSKGTEHLRVLILPEIPRLRAGQWLVVASGALPRQRKKLLLVVEEGNVAVREVKSTHVDEQTGSIEILSIEADENPF